MFTGIVEEIGKIKNIRRGSASCRLTVSADKVLEDVKIGDSIATSGVCLTVTDFDKSSLTADVMHESLDRSALSSLKNGDPVNLERAMPADGRFGGHIVTGHIDGTGRIIKTRRDDNAIWYTVGADRPLLAQIVEKGSITIDGISLTVAGCGSDSFEVSVIPHTAAQTTLGGKRAGAIVNLETDILCKYVQKLMKTESGGVTKDLLKRYDF